MISFFIEGKPEPQGRPRFYPTAKGMRAVDPPKSRAWKEDIAYQAISHRNKVSAPFIEGPVSMSLEFVLPRSKSNKDKLHTIKPDLDNLQKAVKDGLKGVFFKDDAQIVSMSVLRKRYISNGESPGVYVGIEPIEGVV